MYYTGCHLWLSSLGDLVHGEGSIDKLIASWLAMVPVIRAIPRADAAVIRAIPTVESCRVLCYKFCSLGESHIGSCRVTVPIALDHS